MINGRPATMVLTLLAAAFGCGVAGAQDKGQPKISLAQPSWDFGEIIYPQKKELNLAIQNVGGKTLTIHEVKSSCGCTVAQPEKYILDPGESTNVKIVYDSMGREGRASSSITIHSNDPRRPELKFELSGTIKHLIEVDPFRGVHMRVLDASERAERVVKIENTTDEPIKPKITESPSPYLTTSLKEIEPGKRYELYVRTKPPLGERDHREKIVLTTGHPQQKTIELRAGFQIIDRVNLLTPAVFVQEPITRWTQRRVRVEYFGEDSSFQVFQAETDDPSIRLRLSPPNHNPPEMAAGTPNQIVELTLSFPPGTDIPDAGVPARIYTSDPEYPELRFRIVSDPRLYKALVFEARERSQRRSP